MDDIRERQENEVIALQSIYLNECVDLREELAANANAKGAKSGANATAVPAPNIPVLRIRLFPQNSQSQGSHRDLYVQIDLRIKMTPNYPNE